MSKSLLLIALLVSGAAWAQTATEWSPPPLVPAAPPPMPAPEPTTTQALPPGTPPPPSATQPPAYVPGQPSKSGYQYSPYGQPRSTEKPGPEVGLMVSEGLFGALTMAGVTILPYFLLFSSNSLPEPVGSVLFVVIFAAAPLASAQTQLGIANGSRYYNVDSWIPMLTGLAGMAGVLGVFYATGWLPTAQASGGVPNGGSVAWLMIGSIGVVPLLQMAAINLFKQPKPGMQFAIGDPVKRQGIAFAPPSLAPVVNTSTGAITGAQLSLFRGIW
ncbi:MAG: hypothetical protein ACOZQL_31565 [Myxococcota bacterium]